MIQKLQNLIFPADERLQEHWRLYYTGLRCVTDADGGRMQLPGGAVIGFATYLNGFPLEKWRRYTPLEAVELRLTVQGRLSVVLVGYRLDPVRPERREMLRRDCDFDAPTELRLPFPDGCGDELLAFELLPREGCTLRGGGYYGRFPEGSARPVTLALATTTCRKEAFITRTIGQLKQHLLAEGSDIREHLYVHVVDNGRTLDAAGLEGYHLRVHPNRNTGGSGGFARGMLEALGQTPPATHVLLMDDDVLVLPESIRRTYVLLTLLRPEYHTSFLSGSMLEYGAMNIQHEDVGTVAPDGAWRPARPAMDQEDLACVLETNRELLPADDPYAGWWYCCIPADTIRRQGLPLPLFVRCDDIEYSLRCRPPHILTMTGICIWHMGFRYKYNAAMDLYQRLRNMFAAKAVTGAFARVDVLGLWQRLYRQQLREYAYGGAELLLRALEDYLQGPDFFRQDRGEEILQRNARCNETLQPIEEFGVEVRLEDVYNDPPRRFADKVICALTCNGQKFWPRRLLRGGVGIIGFDDSYQPQAQSLRRRLLAVNVFDRTAAMREQDRARFRALERRRRQLLRQYARRRAELEAGYAAARAELTGEAFWRRYLGL